MKVHDWGILGYEEARIRMQEVHTQACETGENHLILCQHPPIFTLGQDIGGKDFGVPVCKTDRGGSITCHSPGQNIYYFCFHAPSAPRFFAQVIRVFEAFFARNLPKAAYQKENPGFYLGDKKLLSLGFRYQKGVSLHGVALNVDVDLAFHNQVNPCGLEGIRTGSLKDEGLGMGCEEINQEIIKTVCEVFDESL